MHAAQSGAATQHKGLFPSRSVTVHPHIFPLLLFALGCGFKCFYCWSGGASKADLGLLFLKSTEVMMGEKTFYNILLVFTLTAQSVKNLPYSVGDLGLIPGSGRSDREGNGYPLQYSCLENPMDRGAWWAIVHESAYSQTWLMDWHFVNVTDVSRTKLHTGNSIQYPVLNHNGKEYEKECICVWLNHLTVQ